MFREAGAAVIGFPSFPGGGTPTTPPAQPADYVGVTMDADKPGTAIVYVDTTEPGPAGPPLRVTLRAPGLGVKTQDIARPPRGSFLRWVRTSERDDPRFGVQFSIGDWLQQAGNGTLDLTASADFPPGTSSYSVRECPLGIACAADNRYTLTGVPVQRVTSVHVVSLELRSGTAPLNQPLQVLS